MTEIEFLFWVKGPALQFATIFFVVGSLVRILEIIMLGRKASLAEARGSAMAGGWRTVFTRTVPDSGTLRRSAFTVITGFVFHIGLFVIIFLFVPHILFFKEVLGVSWPGIATPLVDAVTIVTMITLLAVLLHRIMDPVLRLLSGFQDYLVWFVTLLPVVTGYLAFHRLYLPAPTLLAVHILSVEVLMVMFPLTKLTHAFTLVMARWYNGAISGYRGVKT